MEPLPKKTKMIKKALRRNKDQCNSFQMEPNMKVNGTQLLKIDMEEDIRSGVMAPSMKDIGKMIKLMDEVV